MLIKNEDKTEQIDSCNLQNGKWHIKFHNTTKIYTYSKENIQWVSNPKILDPTNSIVYKDKQSISGITYIQDFGKHIRLFFKNGYKKIYIKSELTIEKSCLSNKKANNCFGCLKALQK